MKRMFVKILPVFILLCGVAAFAVMVATRDAPERRHIVDAGPLVEAITAPAQQLQVIVSGQGTVRPSAQIELVPQVPGVAVWKAPQLEAGGFFARGDLLLRIDPRDYELAVTRAKAAVARSRYALELVSEEAAVARQEWEMMQEPDDGADAPGDLVLRLPQVRAAKADLEATTASLEEARLRLSRTEIHAPFTGRALTVALDAGQYVKANQPVASIYSIEKAEIIVPVLDEDMAWFDVPMPLPPELIASGISTADEHSPAAPIAAPTTSADVRSPAEQPPGIVAPRAMPEALISTEFAGRRQQWKGRVVRAKAELDPRSRMVHLVIEVDGPYAGRGGDRAPLLVGMFVDVDILGNEVDGVRAIPRMALRDGDLVWVADDAGRLHMRPAQVVRVRGEEALVRLQLAEAELVVVSQLSGATDGMKVRVSRRETSQ